MRLPATAFATALLAFLLLTETEAVSAALAVLSAGTLVAVGYREGRWPALRCALLVPAAALAADVITFTPLSLQEGPEANIYTPAAIYYLPAWALLVAIGVLARRFTRRVPV